MEYVQAEAEDVCDTAEDSDGRNDQVDNTTAKGQMLAVIQNPTCPSATNSQAVGELHCFR